MDEIKSRKAQRLDTDERIMRSAIAEFAKRGYKGARIVDMAKGAEISQGRIAQNFGGKKQLFLKIVQRAVDGLSTYLSGKDGEWRELLNEVTECVKANTATKEGLILMQMMGSALGDANAPKEAYAISGKALMQSKIPAALILGQQKGEVKSGDIAVLYGIFYKTMSGVITACKINGMNLPPNDWFFGILENK